MSPDPTPFHPMPHATHSGPLCTVHVNTQRGWRGGERQTLWLAAALERLGHRAIVAARGGEQLAQRAAAAGLEVVELSPRFEGDPQAAWQLRKIAAQHDAGIIHAHAAHAVAIGALATLGRDGARLVVTRRMDTPLRNNLGTRWKYGRASAIVAISRAAARALESSGVPAERIEVVHSGVDLQRVVSPASRTTLAELGVPDGAPLVVQVGHLAGDKDPVTLVRAMRHVTEQLPHAHALLVGDGPLRSEVELAVAQLRLGNTVTLAGHRTDADELLAAADVVTLTSTREGLGSVLLDALACGRPVVATRAGGIPEVVQDGITGFLAEPGDAPALALGIVRLLQDRQLWEQMSAASRERSREFGMDAIATRTLEVYRSVLAGAGARGR